METQNVDNQQSNINPSINNQPTQTPIQKYNSVTLILCLIIVILVGVSAYLFGVNQGKTRTSINPDTIQNNDQISTRENTSASLEVNSPTNASTYSLKNESILIDISGEATGNRTYQYEFYYPSNWSAQKITSTHNNDTYTKNCTDYRLTNSTTNTNVIINMMCNGWTAKYSPLPNDYIIVQQTEKVGVSKYTNYLIRYYKPNTNIYYYADAQAFNGEELKNLKILDVILVTPPVTQKDEYFIPVIFQLSAPSGATISSSDKTPADEIIKSIKLSRVN